MNKQTKETARIAIIGGGVAGVTTAIVAAEHGLNVSLFEAGTALVNGPPACHLHAGGNLYRELSDAHCLSLLEQSLQILKAYPHTLNPRPTLIALPKDDAQQAMSLIPRLQLLQARYRELVTQDPSNQLLGEPDAYFALFTQAQMQALAELPLPAQPASLSEWLIAPAKQLQLENLQFPLIAVQEHGLSLLRLAASAELACEGLNNCHVHYQSRVLGLDYSASQKQWLLSVEHNGLTQCHAFDYVVNACGYQSGKIDDKAGFMRQRMVEFKAAYLTQCQLDGRWPEFIVHGERGTPRGMAQLTPYPEGIYQLHGMTQDITLFDGGLAYSTKQSAQPPVAAALESKITQGWPAAVLQQRSERAIVHMSQHLPAFAQASPLNKALFGAQQIPGNDLRLRSSTVSFDNPRYARAEIVKFSAAPQVAFEVMQDLEKNGLYQGHIQPMQSAANLQFDDVLERALAIAAQRAYPSALAYPYA